MEWEKRKRAGKNVTTADYKAAEKAPRMLPLRWDEMCTLFMTWALLLKMQWLAKQIEPGCMRLKSGEEIQPRKRLRSTRANK